MTWSRDEEVIVSSTHIAIGEDVNSTRIYNHTSAEQKSSCKGPYQYFFSCSSDEVLPPSSACFCPVRDGGQIVQRAGGGTLSGLPQSYISLTASRQCSLTSS